MNHRLEIRHLGPIETCSMTIDEFTVLTGPQASGKSTIAKAIYFFKTVKQDILNFMSQGGPRVINEKSKATWNELLGSHLKEKFLQLFGTSWVMPSNMEMVFYYTDDRWIKVYVTPGDDPSRNYLQIGFSDRIKEYLTELDEHIFSDMTVPQKANEERQLAQLFNDNAETLYIPAGRNLITLLTSQLNYIFTSLEGSQLRNIDYVTKKYTELILKLKPVFSHGMQGIVDERKNNPIYSAGYIDNKSAINKLLKLSKDVLNGEYRYVDGEERLYMRDSKYVKINLASSGQQEVIWIFNLLLYYLLEGKPVFIIVEEPESHLYPNAQDIVGQLLALMHNCGNALLVTTHSPYILGTFNYLTMASQVPIEKKEAAKQVVDKKMWIDKEKLHAYYMKKGKLISAEDTADNLKLIKNEMIDGASDDINRKTEDLLELLYESGDE